MKNLVAGLALASLLACTRAVNPNGDPTDLNNYPPCAVGFLVRKETSGLRADQGASNDAFHKHLVLHPIAGVSLTERASAPPPLLLGFWPVVNWLPVLRLK